MNLKNLATLLIITLITTTTPAMAVETEQNINGNVADDWNEEWNVAIQNSLDDIMKLLDEESGTELTPEQTEYLDAHQDMLISKGESVLYNLQDVQTYLTKELNKYGINSRNSASKSKRSNKNNFAADAEKRVEQLKTTNSNLNIQTKEISYDDLKKGIESGTYNKNEIIVQINDKGYIRYMGVEDINESCISLKSPKMDKHPTKTIFLDKYMVEKNVDSFNIIIVPIDTNIQKILNNVYNFQMEDLNRQNNFYTLGITISPLFVGVASGLMINGWLRCNENGKNRIKEQIREARPGPTESTYLITYYDRYVDMTDQSADIKQKKARRLAIVGLVSFLFFGGMVVTFAALKIFWEIERNNLNQY